MEKLHYPLCLLRFLSLLLLSSSEYTPATKYFINCGSDSNFTLVDRTFVGDNNKNSNPSFSVGISEPIQNKNPSPGISQLYQTARIYRKLSSYEFNIPENGTYLVRLHFLPFSSDGTSLNDAIFNVSASNFSLLSNFSAQNSTEFPVIKEFYLNYVNVGKFEIYFKPAEQTSFAFINAIEVFLLPTNYTLNPAIAVPPLVSEDGTFNSLRSKALRTIYRINVGGQEVNDSLWRNWVPDDSYLTVRGSARNCNRYNGNLGEEPTSETVEAIAPEAVYRTCKEVIADDNTTSNFPNITWRFTVSKNTAHFVRLIFCDILSNSPGYVKFNLHISTNNYLRQIPENDGEASLLARASPVYYDFMIPRDDSGYMSISIGIRNDSDEKFAYLNGLEIMEFVGNANFELPPEDERNNHKHLALIICSVAGVAFIFILSLISFLGLRWRRGKTVKALILKTEFANGKGRSQIWISERTENGSRVAKLNLKLKMSLAEIKAATDNFNTKLLIGEGGFGRVYKGTLGNGMKVAVKRSHSSHGQGLPEFQTEVIVLSKIRHRHLVSLVGYCDEGSEMILVYEFMEKGTLRDHLYNWKNLNISPSTTSELTWKQRLEICIGSAKGLHYLHTGPDGGILHRDVKSTNILLDEHYVAKVADFGLSQSGTMDPDDVSVGLKGSFGYLDPEYFITLQLTNKSDVYSFGVVLLEVLCARPPIVSSHNRDELNLAEWGMFWQKKGQLEKIIDPLLVGNINPNSLRKFGEIAEKCLKPDGADRPSMLDVCWDLEYALQLQQTAVHREPYEDSTTTGASSNLVLPVTPSSNSFRKDDIGLPLGNDDDSETTSSTLFCN